RKLDPQGAFIEASLPAWVTFPRCSQLAVEQPPAIVAPIFDVDTSESKIEGAENVRSTVRWQQGRCFAATIDQSYLSATLFPQLILQSFGETSASEYDFSVVSLKRPGVPLYGPVLHADLRKPFFAMPDPLAAPRAPFGINPQPGHMVVVRRVETIVTKGRGNFSEL